MMYLEQDTLGQRIDGRWELRHRVGQGGMGTVYQATDSSSGQIVAFKMLHADNEQGDDRFLREVKTLSELRHPAIVSYLGHGRTGDQRPFLVMEWLEGEDLSARLKRRDPLSVAQILDVAIHVAEALEFAHGKGIIHRDIKPANIFLHKESGVKVLDFGIARKVGAETLTQTGAVVGTIEYMAPEQIRSSRQSEARSDIYSLGCVLFECFSGSPPFTGTLVAAILANVLFEEPPSLAAANPSLPRALTDLVDSMLRKEPQQRPSIVSETLREIRRQIDDAHVLPENRHAAASKMVMTHGELRMMTAVLASPAANATAMLPGADTLPFGSPVDSKTKEAELPVGLYPGVRLSMLADGWLLGVFERVGQVGLQEQIFHAAQLARDIRRLRPDSQIAIAVSQAGGSHPTMVGPLVETCTKMLARRSESEDLDKRPPGIWLDEVGATMLSGRFNVESTPLGNRLLDRRVTSNSQVLFLGKPIQCIGRDTELSTLELWANSCFEDSVARAALLVASPGLGKTRLLHEFLRRLERRDPSPLVLASRCDPLSESTPYGPLQEALRHHFGLQAGQADAEQRRRLTDAISEKVSHEASRVVEFLGELVGVPFSAQESPQLAAARHDPKVMSDQISLALTDYLLAECAIQPVLLVIEDLHFCDSLTTQMVEGLLTEMKESPFMVIAVGRPELNDKFPQLWTTVPKDVMSLRGLNKKAAERLVVHMLGAGTAPALIERMVQLADGNALFLEELIRTVSAGQSDTLPPTILAVLQQRVQSLPADARRTLRAASIFGQAFWKGGVTALTGLSATEVDDWLLYLSRAEVIERRRHSRFAKDNEYAFRHALMCESVNRMVTDEDRRVGHGLAAQYLVHAGEQDAFVLASHFESSGDLKEAAKYNVRAASECLARYDGPGARKGALRALEQGVEGELRGVAASILAQALYWGVEWKPVPQWASEAFSLCPAGGPEYCRALSVFMMTAVMSGQTEHIGPLVGKFLTTEPQPEALDAYTEAGNFMVLMFVMLAERPLVETFLGRLEKVIATAPEFSLSRAMLSFCHGAYLRLLSSDAWRAVELLQDAYLRFQKAGDIRNESLAACLMGLAEREVGNFEAGDKALTHAMQLAERIAGTMVPTVQMHVALLYENSTDAVQRQRGFDIAQQVVDGFGVNAVYSALAKGVVARGMLQHDKNEEAAALAADAKAALAQTPTMQAIVVPTHVDALTKSGRIENAIQAAQELIALYDKLGDAGCVEPIGRLSAARAFFAAGNDEEGTKQRDLAKKYAERRAERAPNDEARQRFISCVPEIIRALAGA